MLKLKYKETIAAVPETVGMGNTEVRNAKLIMTCKCVNYNECIRSTTHASTGERWSWRNCQVLAGEIREII